MRKTTKQITAGVMAVLILSLTPQSILAEELADAEPAFEEDETDANEAAATSEEAIPELSSEVKGMPSDYVPDEEELAEKAKMTEYYGAQDSFDELTEGVDYAENEIWFLADTKSDAITVAEAFGGTLRSFEYGVATVLLNPEILSVEEAVRLGADPESTFPVVSPNFINYQEEPEMTDKPAEDPGISLDSVAVGDGRLRYGWAEWFEDALGRGVNIDPALYPNFQDEKAGYSYQWMHDYIYTWQAWQEAPNLGKGITVAVIDTNVLDTHEDLKGRVTPNRTVKPDWYDDEGHGTHVAGIIAASKGNGLGGAGIAPNASILAIPVFEKIPGETGSRYMDEDLAKAVNAAVEAKVDIINLSLSGPNYDPELEEVFRNAYQKDVTVIAAMGNANTNNREYPAAYEEYVIGVAAVDENGQRSVYSSYGSWADIAAPGDDIYSTCVSGTSEEDSYATTNNVYEKKQGTSMATPVIAGVCALYMGEKGHVSPEEMLRVLKANVSNASYAKKAQIGAGIIDLQNMFGEHDAEAPVLYANNEKIASEVQMDKDAILTFRSEEETDSFLYSLNGKSPTVKNGELTSGYRIEANKSGNVFEAEISILDLLESGLIEPGKKVTLKASAVALGGAIGKEGSWTVTVEKQEDEVYRVDVSGQTGISQGKSAAYKATLLPKNLKKKTVTWSLDGAPEGVSINKNGTVKVEKSVPVGSSFLVVATSDADPKITGAKTVTILEPVASVILTADSITKTAELMDYREHVYVPAYKKGVLQSVRLFTVDIPNETVTVNGKAILNDTKENVLRLSANAGDKTHSYLYKSSNTKVATVDTDGTVTALSEGKTTITCTADDGSKKKASVTVNVIIPASGIYLKAENDRYMIGAGKTAKTTAILGNAYGTPTIKKTSWDYKAYEGATTSEEPKDITELVKSRKLASISNGKLTTGTGLLNYYDVKLVSEAVTTDGTGSIDESGQFVPSEAENGFFVIPATKKLFIIYGGEHGEVIEVKNTVSIGLDLKATYSYMLLAGYYSGRQLLPNNLPHFAVTSSNPEIASATAGEYSLKVTPFKRGKTTIKVRALDGSNVTRSFTVQVQ